MVRCAPSVFVALAAVAATCGAASVPVSGHRAMAAELQRILADVATALTKACPDEVKGCTGDAACLMCIATIDQEAVTEDQLVGATCDAALAALQAAIKPLVPGTCDITEAGALNTLATCGVDALNPETAPCGTVPPEPEAGAAGAVKPGAGAAGAKPDEPVESMAPTSAPTSAPTAAPAAV